MVSGNNKFCVWTALLHHHHHHHHDSTVLYVWKGHGRRTMNLTLSTTVCPFVDKVHCHGLHCRCCCSSRLVQTEQYPTDPVVVRHFEFSTHLDDGILRASVIRVSCFFFRIPFSKLGPTQRTLLMTRTHTLRGGEREREKAPTHTHRTRSLLLFTSTSLSPSTRV